MNNKRIIIGVTIGIIAAILWSVVFINVLDSMAGIGIGICLGISFGISGSLIDKDKWWYKFQFVELEKSEFMEKNMNITYGIAEESDAEKIYQLSKQLIDDYENIEYINYEKVLSWIREKIQNHIKDYSVIFVDGTKAGYYRFCKNHDKKFEIDDLYILPQFQNKGIGSKVICQCCAEVDEPVMLYVFVKNHRAVSLYKRLGFEVLKNIKDSRYIMLYNKK